MLAFAPLADLLQVITFSDSVLVHEALSRCGNDFKARDDEPSDERHADFDVHEKVDERARSKRDKPRVLIGQQEEQDKHEASDETKGHSSQEFAPNQIVQWK